MAASLATIGKAQTKKPAAKTAECTDASARSLRCEWDSCFVEECRDGKIVIDEQATKDYQAQADADYVAWQKEQAADDALARAMVTRVLTEDELDKALSIGEVLFAANRNAYDEDEVEKKFLNALKIQIDIRQLAATPSAQTCWYTFSPVMSGGGYGTLTQSH